MNDISAEPIPKAVRLLRQRRQVTRGPLTFQQLFLWDYLHLQPSEALRDTFVFRVVGSLDSALLAKSLSEIVRRHDCLRTRIVTTNGTMEQHVDESVEFELEVVDLADGGDQDLEVRARNFLHEFDGRKYDLAVGPPMAAALIRTSAADQLLAWAIHHLIADGVTVGIVLEEMWSIYGELLQGSDPREMRPPVRYLDYARWQHATHDDWLLKHGDYWQGRIARAVRVHWPADPHAANDQHTNASFEMKLGMPQLAELRSMARSARTTPAMVMLAVYAAVVASWCGQSAFTIPVNVSGRHRPEHEHAGGYFAQFLYVGVEIAANATFLELLARISGEFRDALLHQDFGKVAAQMPDVHLGSMFSWVPWKSGGIGIPASSIAEKIGVVVQQFPFVRPYQLEFRGIGVFFCEADGEYSAALWYRTDAFSTGTVERFALQLRSLCERVMTDPHCLVVQVSSR